MCTKQIELSHCISDKNLLKCSNQTFLSEHEKYSQCGLFIYFFHHRVDYLCAYLYMLKCFFIYKNATKRTDGYKYNYEYQLLKK